MSDRLNIPCDCGHRKCEGFQEWVIDPYVQELYARDEWVHMCGGQYYEACMDI